MLFISVFSLFFAYFVEYIFTTPVCPLCVYQRFPYLMLILISIIGIQFQEDSMGDSLYRYYFVTFFIAILIAAYHSGVERGIFEMSTLCKPAVEIADDITIEDFKKILESIKPAMCNKPSIVIFGLSMAEWNLLLNVFLFTMLSLYQRNKFNS